MKSNLKLLLVSLLFAQCTASKTIEYLDSNSLQELESFQSLPLEHQLEIATAKEKGRRLWLCLRFQDRDGKALKHENIQLYHTTADGEYERADPQEQLSARLSGTVITDKDGRVLIKTILPGGYGGSNNGRHIHTNVEAANPRAYDIHFNQYTGFMGRRFIAKSNQHFLADLQELKDGTLITFLSIQVKLNQ